MRADYDNKANAISIALVDERYDLDLEALIAAAQAALAAPNRSVTVDVATRSAV